MVTELCMPVSLPLALELEGGFMIVLYAIPIILWIGAAVWVLWDSLQRTGEWGLLWGFLAFGCAPIVAPLYFFTTVMVDRPAPAWVKREREFQKEQDTKFKGMTEFDRVRFLEAAAGGQGTLYAGPGLQPSQSGAKLFPDAHADSLVEAKDYDAAFIYLYDMYLLALEDNDPRGEQTYKFYLSQLPQGLDLLKRARDGQITPGALKAAGMSLIAGGLAPSASRVRPVTDDPTTAEQHLPAGASSTPVLPPGTNLERLLNAQEDTRPQPSPERNSGVQPPRPAKPVSGNSKVPF